MDKDIGGHFTVIAFNHFPEWIIDRILDQNIIPRFCISLHRHCQCKDNSRSLCNPLLVDLPSVTAFHPGTDRIIILLIRLCISISSMLSLTNQCLLDKRGRLKIHISDPQRKNIFLSPSFFCKIILQTVGSSSLYRMVKIQILLTHFYSFY